MPRIDHIETGYCIPLLIGPEDKSESGSRLGGCSPAGVIPQRITSQTRYFCTIRLNDDPVREASIFISFDFDAMADHSAAIQPSGHLFEVVVHKESIRTNDSHLMSELSAHPLFHGTISEDFFIDNDSSRIVRTGHKLGGYPYIQDCGECLPEAVAREYQNGYFQVLQMDFPGAMDGDVGGNWPFAGGIFHLLGREPLEDCSWLSFWEY